MCVCVYVCVLGGWLGDAVSCLHRTDMVHRKETCTVCLGDLSRSWYKPCLYQVQLSEDAVGLTVSRWQEEYLSECM